MNIQEIYQNKLMSAEDLAGQFQSGWSCVTDIAAAIPPAIMRALTERVKKDGLTDIRLHTLLDLTPLASLEVPEGIRSVSWFSGGGLRDSINAGRADLMPCYYRDMPQLYRDYIDCDAFVLTVSPMDNHGYFSCGVAGSYTEAVAGKAKRIYLEVNKEMPRVYGTPLIHISQVTALCEHHVPLPLSAPVKMDDVSRRIGALIAGEIPDGATLQVGIGAVPEAVVQALYDKKDLGIHTELFTDGMVELIERGVVTNEKKPVNRGKSVATLTFGSKRIYEYIDNNPAFLMGSVDYVNDPAVIAQHPNFISINAALEVDFFGQVCAESMGTRHISGSGGQVDYVRGATQSKGGKSFIAFPSTARGGTVSRIAPILTPGSIVTTSKNDVDYIVTEYGIAKLRGRTLGQRTKALINIAHPKFREKLTFEARKRNILI